MRRSDCANHMKLRCVFLAVTVATTLLPIRFCSGQSSQQWNGTGSKHSPISRKQIIERHFESIQPRPRPQFDAATPGVHLIGQQRVRAAQLQNRIRARLASSQAAASSSGAMPGIQFRAALPTGSIPTSVVTGDFNGDGHTDFVVANGIDNNLWLYLGKDDGTFQLPRIVPLSKGLAPVGIAAGDLRGSGKLDLVVAEFDTSSIGVLLGNGDGTFGYETEYALPESAESIVVADFNHDGKLDIAAGLDDPVGDEPYIAVLTGDGTGKFGTPILSDFATSPSTAWNLAAGDVNNDGLPDLLLTGPGYENAQVLINNGDGTFAPGQTVLYNGEFTVILDGRLADVNGDGCADAVIADAASFAWVALGDCSGNFAAPKTVQMGDSPAAVRVVDVNGDGFPDIVTSALPALGNQELGFASGNTLSVALGDGKGNFSVGRDYVGTSQAYSIGVADFNGDGHPDFVTANNDTDTVTVYQNDGTGNFGFPQGIFAGVPGQGTINNPFSTLSFADLNNDGKTDVFFIDEGISGEFYTTGFLNDGTGKLSGPITSDTGAAIASNWIADYRLGDFRNTGKLDMIGIGVDQASSSSAQFILFLAGNGDGTFAKGTPVATTGADGRMAIGDFNQDGKLDFVAVNGQDTHTFTTFLGNGDGTFRALAPVTFTDTGNSVGGTTAAKAYTGDFNRDGKLDVLIFTTGNGYWTTESSVWELDGNGDGTFQTPRQLYTDFQPFVLADVNGDGHPDIARYDFMWPGTTETLGPAKFTTYLGQADGSFLQDSSYAPYSGVPESVQPYQENGDPLATSLVADFNADGKPEEVAFQFQQTAQGQSLPYAQFLMGNGDGTFTPNYDIFQFYYGYPVYAHDLDGDGMTDMVEVDNANSQVRVIKGAPAPALQVALEDAVVTGNASCGYVFPNIPSSSAQSVTLFSSVAGVQLPSSITIPPNALGAQFCYTLASNFDWHQVFDINAQLDGSTATAYASSSYVLGFSETLSSVVPPVLYAGQSSDPSTLTLTSSQGYSSTVKLYCEGLIAGDSCQFGTDTLAVSPAGAASTTVTFVLAPNAPADGTIHPFTVVADDGNVIQRQTASVEAASFTMYAINSPLQASAPGSVSTYFNVLGIPPFSFSCSGLPAGATCSFSGTQASYPSPSGLLMTINIPSNTVAGSYPVQVTGTSGRFSASQSTTLQILNFSMQGPSASNDWTLTNLVQPITVTLSASATITSSQYVGITCALDVPATCFGAAVPVSQTPQPIDLSLIVPTGTPTGQHVLTVTATYGSLKQNFTFPFYVADYSGSLSPSTITIGRGATGKITASLNATTGFDGTIALACSGTAQVTCSFSPGSTQLTASSPQTVTITLDAGASASVQPPSEFSAKHLFALAALFPLGLLFNWRRRRLPALFLMAAGLLFLVSTVSCGSGGSTGGSSTGEGYSGGGGSNSYTLTVNATFNNTSLSRTLGAVNVTVTH